MLIIIKTYKNYVDPYINTFTAVNIKPEMTKKIHEFVSKVIESKRKEAHHRIDGHNEYKRFYTGMLGEAALEEYLMMDIIDWRVGDSNFFNVADLKNAGMNLGIKTVEYGKFPIIHKDVKRAEIVNIKINDNKVLICGLATIDNLKNHQDDYLILSPSLRHRGTKTGFYGFHELMQFNNLEELMVLYR